MSSTGGRRSKPVRPILVGSTSVDLPQVTASSSDTGKKARRHSVTSGTVKDRETDGSLKRVSKWFKDIKIKMDPKQVKDRIRYSRSSLVSQAEVTEQETEQDKTATWGPRAQNRKMLEKRSNSMECIPAVEAPRPSIRKMISLQFEAGDSRAPETDQTKERNPSRTNTAHNSLDAQLSMGERLAAMTEEISAKLNERERILTDIVGKYITRSSQRGFDSQHAVCFQLLASASLANELAHLINASIGPEHLHGPVHNAATPGDGVGSKSFICVKASSKLVDVISRLHQQLQALMEAVEENEARMRILKQEVRSSWALALQPEKIDLESFPDSISDDRTAPDDSSRFHSLSDSECFLSLVKDLTEHSEL